MNMKDFRIKYNKLIGRAWYEAYNTEESMIVLNWMLKTDRTRTSSYNPPKDGVNKAFLRYSANNHDRKCCLPKRHIDRVNFFDAGFSRVLCSVSNRELNKWKQDQRFTEGRSRVIKVPENKIEYSSFNGMLDLIFATKGRFLKKEFAHPYFQDRINPKITWINVFTIGEGWAIEVSFSFEKFNYECVWTSEIYQNRKESTRDFIYRAYSELEARCITKNQNNEHIKQS